MQLFSTGFGKSTKKGFVNGSMISRFIYMQGHVILAQIGNKNVHETNMKG